MSSPASDNGLATRIANALSDGINCLHALLRNINVGGLPEPEAKYNGANIDRAMHAFEWALTELSNNKQIQGAPPLTEEDVLRARRLRELIKDWLCSGDASPEIGSLAQQTIYALAGEKGAKSLARSSANEAILDQGKREES